MADDGFMPDGFEADEATAAPPSEPPNGVEAALRGVLQGASFGWSDEAAAAIEAAFPDLSRSANPDVLAAAPKDADYAMRYAAAKEYFRRRNKEAAGANPKTYIAGTLAGGLLTAGGAAKGAAKAGPLLARAARSGAIGAGTGAVAGAGASEAEGAGGVARDAAGGAILGASIGGALPMAGAAFSRSADYLGRKAVDSGRKALSGIGTPLSARKPISEEAVRQAIDSKAIRPFGTVTGAAERLGAQAETLGDEYGTILRELEAAGVRGPNAITLADALSKAAKEARRNLALGAADTKEKVAGALREAAPRAPFTVPWKFGDSRGGARIWDYPDWTMKPVPGRAYRGMTAEEFESIRAAGGIKSNQRWSVPGEGTSFAEDMSTALDYAQIGSTNPLRTGKPVYVTEVVRPPSMVRSADGYLKEPGLVPESSITRVWRFDPDGSVSLVDDSLPLTQAESIKRNLQREANYQRLTDTAGSEAKKDVASMVRQAIEDEVEAQAGKAPEQAARFLPVKQALARTLEARKAAEEGAARAARRKPLSLTDTVVGTGAGAATGNPLLGLATGAAHGIADRRLASTNAVLLRALEKAARKQASGARVPATAAEEAALLDMLGLRAAGAAAEEGDTE